MRRSGKRSAWLLVDTELECPHQYPARAIQFVRAPLKGLKGTTYRITADYACGLPHAEAYADACHMCYEVRHALRKRFPEILGPDQMYGVVESE